MINKTLPINLDLSAIKRFCQDNNIKKLSLFGSVLRDDFTSLSDVDILVEFKEGKTPGFDIIRMEDELSLIVSRKVDLRTYYDLSKYFRDEVLTEAKIIYDSSNCINKY